MGKNKSILVTGGAGFIGSNFIPYFLNKYPNYQIVCLDKLTYAGDLKNLKEVANSCRFHFVQGDICNQELTEYIFKTFDIKGVIHFAAESHVDNSIKNPGVFIKTNVDGTYTLLNTARNYWMEKPFKYKQNYQNCRFHHISTDEVYGTLDLDSNELFTENTPYAPNSPYSASKASSDMIVRSYRHTYGMDVVITNCSNNFGPKQHPEKLIPTVIKNAISGNPIPIYGDGKNVRDWLYVLDHCSGIDAVYHFGEAGETYNIGANNELSNIELVNKICDILEQIYPSSTNSNLSNKKYKDLITFVEDRAGHDRRYAIDNSKIRNSLNWFPEHCFEKALQDTCKYYIEKFKNRQ